jgi:hypothetical protein
MISIHWGGSCSQSAMTWTGIPSRYFYGDLNQQRVEFSRGSWLRNVVICPKHWSFRYYSNSKQFCTDEITTVTQVVRQLRNINNDNLRICNRMSSKPSRPTWPLPFALDSLLDLAHRLYAANYSGCESIKGTGNEFTNKFQHNFERIRDIHLWSNSACDGILQMIRWPFSGCGLFSTSEAMRSRFFTSRLHLFFQLLFVLF